MITESKCLVRVPISVLIANKFKNDTASTSKEITNNNVESRDILLFQGERNIPDFIIKKDEIGYIYS